MVTLMRACRSIPSEDRMEPYANDFCVMALNGLAALALVKKNGSITMNHYMRNTLAAYDRFVPGAYSPAF